MRIVWIILKIFFAFQSFVWMVVIVYILSVDCPNCLYCHDVRHQAFESNFTLLVCCFFESNPQNRVPFQPNTASLIQVVWMCIKSNSPLRFAVYFMNFAMKAGIGYAYLSCCVCVRERELVVFMVHEIAN